MQVTMRFSDSHIKMMNEIDIWLKRELRTKTSSYQSLIVTIIECFHSIIKEKGNEKKDI